MPYKNFQEHISDELKLLALRVWCVHKQSEKLYRDKEDYGLLAPGVQNMLSLLDSLILENSDMEMDEELGETQGRIEGFRKEIGEALVSTPESRHFPFIEIQNKFGLSEEEKDILVATLACEIDSRWRRIYGYCNDDMTCQLPTPGFVADILQKKRIEFLRHFFANAPLMAFGLIRFHPDSHALPISERPEPGMTMPFILNERILSYILGDTRMASILSDSVTLISTESARQIGTSGKSPAIAEADKEKNAVQIIQETSGKRLIFWMHGNAQTAKEAFALSVCKTLGCALLKVDMADIVASSYPTEMLKSVLREAIIQSASVFLTAGEIREPERRTEEENAHRQHDGAFYRKRLFHVLAQWPDSIRVFISADSYEFVEYDRTKLAVYPIEFAPLGYYERVVVWKRLLSGTSVKENEVETISARFRLEDTQMRDVVEYARKLHPKDLQISHIYEAIRCCIPVDLGLQAHKMPSCHTWEDIVLPPERLQILQDVCGYIRHTHTIYHTWGFAHKMSLGKGINILFSGLPGTGKTMAASIVASDLGMELYKIDLSSLTSKYVGETEKNLRRVFRSASRGHFILFFDEADSLFAKRGEVQQAHDRYANIEASYLLQQMEEHEGIVILATNLSGNMDEAFVRRLTFVLEFPFPDEKQREKIWEKVFPARAPLGRIDFAFLARKVEMAGGNIRNIALCAAFYAARDASPSIEMRHLCLAVQRECQKLGRLFNPKDLAPYYV